MSLLLEGADLPESAASLPGKVLNKGGVLGLIAFVLVLFLATVLWQGQRDLSAKQVETLSAVQQHEAGNKNNSDVERKLQYAMCLSLAKLSKSGPELCEVGR